MFCVLLLAACGWTQDDNGIVRDPGRPYSLNEYQSALDSWISFYEKAAENGCCVAPAEGMPEQITVQEGTREFRVPLPPLQGHPADDKTSATEAGVHNRKIVLGQLRQLRAGLAQYHGPSPGKSVVEQGREQAARILSAGEYRQVRLPGLKESWRDKALQWLVSKLSRFFEKPPDLRFVSQLLMWSIIGIAVVAAGVFAWKMLQTEAGNERWHLGTAPLPVSAKPWDQWLRESHQAAALNDWRQAIRLAYWAAISALESRGAWKPDVARTPREYLALISAQKESGKTLRSLTRDFERVWYAQQPATQADFQDTLKHLQELGCR
jgi:hypothetical protein